MGPLSDWKPLMAPEKCLPLRGLKFFTSCYRTSYSPRSSLVTVVGLCLATWWVEKTVDFSRLRVGTGEAVTVLKINEPLVVYGCERNSSVGVNLDFCRWPALLLSKRTWMFDFCPLHGSRPGTDVKTARIRQYSLTLKIVRYVSWIISRNYGY